MVRDGRRTRLVTSGTMRSVTKRKRSVGGNMSARIAGSQDTRRKSAENLLEELEDPFLKKPKYLE